MDRYWRNARLAISLIRDKSARTTQSAYLDAFHIGNGTGDIVTPSIRKRHCPIYDDMTLIS